MKLRPRTRTVLILAAAPLVILLLLGLLAASLSTAPVRHLDVSLPLALHVFATPLLTRILLAFTWLGALRTVLPAVLLVFAWLFARGRRAEAIQLGVAITGALILNEALKSIFHRPRPAFPAMFNGLAAPPEHTFSFPSGHAFFAVVLYGLLTCLALSATTSALRRLGLIILALCMVLATGLSRVYFAMHNPTDVLAGYLAGALWLAAVIAAARAQLRSSAEPTPLPHAHNGRAARP